MYILTFFTPLSEIFPILRRNERYTIKSVYCFHVKCPLFRHILKTMRFLDTLSKSTEISNLVKIRPVEAEMFRANRQTWRS